MIDSVSITPSPKESHAGNLQEPVFESSPSERLATSRVAISSSALCSQSCKASVPQLLRSMGFDLPSERGLC